ncbi:uncharacterized protein LOC110818082 [Carica papaya]|uniref:uncharacterized protein LOC110818082 n=1 Tax=Carica papaya TaxID=3649 RepID=UPI000B8C8904|nr:uncharacterized protein LOC110818082 [Carica papaya]
MYACCNCNSLFLLTYSGTLSGFSITRNASRIRAANATKVLFPKPPVFNTSISLKSFALRTNTSTWRSIQTGFCAQNDVADGFPNTSFPESDENDGVPGNGEFGLLNKPNPVAISDGFSPEVEKSKQTDKDELLEPFLKFFKPRDMVGELEEEGSDLGDCDEGSDMESKEKEAEKVGVEYYQPKPGDFVVGVVVSGNENRLDVNIGSELLGTMMTKEVLPLYPREMDHLLCDLKNDAEEFMVCGKMGIVKDDDALSGGQGLGRPAVETGTVLFAEVLGRTLSGRPLLSTRRLFRRIAWHRVRQIKQLNEPIEVKITEWNTGGLLTRIEGLRAFLPKAELVNRVNSFTELKENNETNNDLILSEKDAWEMLHLREGTLLEGTVKKIFPYGAQIRIGETNRSGLLHISNISRTRITSVSDLLKVDEKVKVLVVKSMFPGKISLSVADLESKPGLFVSDKERVFAEAEEIAKKYRQKLPAVLPSHKLETPTTNALPSDNEESLYANWKWFKFDMGDDSS